MIAELSQGFTIYPKSSFDVWFKFQLDVTFSFLLADSIETLAEHVALPSDVISMFDEGFEGLNIDQRAKVLLALIGLDESLTPFEKFVDPPILEEFQSLLTLVRSGGYSSEQVSRLAQIYHGVYTELTNFNVLGSTVIEHRDSIVKVFTTQNIKYANGQLNYSRILSILKSQFGEPWPGHIIYKGLVIDRLINENGSAFVSKPTSVMVGQKLEADIVNLYRMLGYAVLDTTNTGDFEIDVIAQSNIEKIGIQCKNYADRVRVEAVMQAHSGGHYYGCTRFVVYGVDGFTQAALDMAGKLKVELLLYKPAL